MTESKTDAPPQYWVFVYGSLRKGLHNFPMTHGCLIGEPIKGAIEGAKLYTNSSDTYPYLAKAPKDGGTVVGELMLMEWNSALQRIIDMELGAGYYTDIVEVHREDGKVTQAIAFFHHEEHAQWRGPRVAGGDWMPHWRAAEERRRYTRRNRYAPGYHSFWDEPGMSEAQAKELLDAETPEVLPARR